MRRIALAIAAVLVILAASAIMATRAVAMSIAAPAGLTPAINETLPTEQVYWRRHWRRRGWGWGWGRGFWGGWRRFWGGFPFFGPRWYGYRHHYRRTHHRPRQKPADKQPKQVGEEQ